MKERVENGCEYVDIDPIRVLVVDDEPIMRDLMKAMLVKLQAEVEVAGNGAEAKKKLVSGSYQMVITDINMPEMDGIALIKWLKQKKPGIETVVMTGIDLSAEMLETIGSNAIECFIKPPQPTMLRNAISHCRQKNRAS